MACIYADFVNQIGPSDEVHYNINELLVPYYCVDDRK
jgi:hypothetical protein